MVTQMDGHVALALFLTVVTNIVGIFTVPLWIKWLIASSINVKLDLTSMIYKLCLTLFLPLVIGKSVRCNKRVREFIQPKKPIQKMLNINLINIIVWTKVSSAKLSGMMDVLTVKNALFIVAWSITIHMLFLVLNTFCSWVLKLPYEQKKAIILLCSQKTIAVGIPVVTFLPPGLGDQGLMIIALIISQIAMIVFDSMFISVWLHIESRRKKNTELLQSNDDELEVLKKS